MKADNVKLIMIISAAALAALVLVFVQSGVFKGKDVVRIEITDCFSIKPAFLSVQKNQPVYLANRGFEDHIVKIAGNTLTIGAGKEKRLGAEFVYGEGTYTYDCDGAINAGQIQIAASEQTVKGAEQTFKEMFDSFPKELQNCVKQSLNDKFEKVYNGTEGFILGASDQEKMNTCLTSTQPIPQQ